MSLSSPVLSPWQFTYAASKPTSLSHSIHRPITQVRRLPCRQRALNTSYLMSPPPLLVGLTGSIGMGKSTVSGFLTAQGVPVLCADDVVHCLYASGGAAVGPVGVAFPAAVVDGAIDRAQLSKCVVGNEAAMKQLEGIVHPLVEAERLRFIQEHAAAGDPIVVFDIPLLYETQAEQQLDVVLVVSAPAEVQQQRVLARQGMTPEKLAAILARQVPDEEKRRRADYVIDTGCSLEETEQQVAHTLQSLKDKQGTAAAKLLPGEDDKGGQHAAA